MNYIVKNFEELTISEFYEIVKQRIAVFVVEQNCPYQEVDEIDAEALHTWLEDEQGNFIAYARIYQTETAIHFGRVLVSKKYRGQTFGDQLLVNVCQKIAELYPGQPIEIGAQAHLQDFYRKCGLETISKEPYLEDGIPHVTMRKNNV